MIEIKPANINNTEVAVPGSKSYTHRILIAASMADGRCTIQNGLKSDDTLFTLNALKQMGVKIDVLDDKFIVHGVRGEFQPCGNPVYLGNSGTSMRLLTAVASLGKGIYTITGAKRMGQRPIQDLIDGLDQIGVKIRSIGNNGCPPVEVTGAKVKGGTIALNCKTSSQYLSALLLIGPYTENGLDISITEGPVSKPYIDMTVEVMTRLGVKVMRGGYKNFRVNGKQTYQAGTYVVEPDCSQAGYFWAAAAITGASVKVKGITLNSRQGDVRFTQILKNMGCEIFEADDGIIVSGRPLKQT